MQPVLKINTEKKLRHWLAANSVNGVTWVEPNRGSSLGVADAFLAVRGAFVAVELKCGRPVSANRLAIDLRPVQLRWHDLAAWNGVPTFCLVSTKPTGNAPSKIYLVDMMVIQSIVQKGETVVISTDKYYDAYRKPISPGEKLQWALGHRGAWCHIGVALIV